jgi:hypothetical protein
MKKSVWYHAVTMEKMNSIMKHGLIKNVLDNGIYFTDSDVSSLNWIKWRENLRGDVQKSMGLISFECYDYEMEHIEDFNRNLFDFFPEILKQSVNSKCVIYRKNIHPNKLTFEECFYDEINEEYVINELQNKLQFIPSTLNQQVNWMMSSLKNTIVFNTKTNEPEIISEQGYKTLMKGGKFLQTQFYIEQSYLNNQNENKMIA